MTDSRAGKETLDDPRELDLGFGERVIPGSPVRLLNRDGTFNVVREGGSFLANLHLYRTLVMMSWVRLFLMIIAAYLGANVVFAMGYLGCGPDAIAGGSAETLPGRFIEAVFFSVQTLTTVGYGGLAPQNTAANLLVSVETLTGLSGFAVAAGLIFARVARPVARIRFSDVAALSTVGAEPSFRFRIVNGGTNELIDVNVRVLVALTREMYGVRVRQFSELKTVRRRIAFFPLARLDDQPRRDEGQRVDRDDARRTGGRQRGVPRARQRDR